MHRKAYHVLVMLCNNWIKAVSKLIHNVCIIEIHVNITHVLNETLKMLQLVKSVMLNAINTCVMPIYAYFLLNLFKQLLHVYHLVVLR